MKRILGLAIVGILIGLAASLYITVTSLSQANTFVFPSPFPSIDPFHTTVVEIVAGPLLPLNWTATPKYQNDIRQYHLKTGGIVEISDALIKEQSLVFTAVGTDASGNTLYEWQYNFPASKPIQFVPNWVPTYVPSPTPTAVSSAQIPMTIPQVVKECEGMSQLTVSGNATDTGRIGDNFFVYLNDRGEVYRVPLTNAQWISGKTSQHLDLSDESVRHTLDTGKIDFICYGDWVELTANWFADHTVFPHQFQMKGSILVFPIE